MSDEYQKQLQVLFEIRDALIELYPEDTVYDTEKYITANELLNKLERIIREEAEDLELTQSDETEN